MNSKFKVISILFVLTLIGIACDDHRGGGSGSGPSPNTNGNEGGPDLSIHLGKEESISKVKLFLERRDGMVTVQLPYERMETVSKPCSQQDVDTDPNKGDEFLARCKPIGGSGPAAPYGSRTMSESRTQCCKPKTVRWTTLQPTWTAEYSKNTDSWSVTMEFDVDAAKKAIAWTVNDKSGEVTEKPSGN